MPEQTKTGFGGVPDLRPLELLARSSPRGDTPRVAPPIQPCHGRRAQAGTHDVIASLLRKSRCHGAIHASDHASPRRAFRYDRAKSAQRGCAARRKRQHPGTADRRACACVRGGDGTARGAASKIACPFVPPNPNEFTPARGGWPVSFGPGLQPLRDPQPQVVERDLRVRSFEMQGLAGICAMLQAQRRLDQSRNAGGRFQ